jgi:hypothetical protein
MNHLMIDLETLSLEKNAAVISVGAVFFDENTLYEEFYETVDIGWYEGRKFDISATTVKWWLKQGTEAIELAQKFCQAGHDVANDFLVFFQDNCTVQDNKPDTRVWSNGVDFDVPIMQNLLRENKIATPWSYYNHRCYRTMAALIDRKEYPWTNGIKHCALHDAVYQARRLQYVADKLKLTLL